MPSGSLTVTDHSGGRVSAPARGFSSLQSWWATWVTGTFGANTEMPLKNGSGSLTGAFMVYENGSEQ